MIIESPEDGLLAAMPLYAKTHSRGEFIFDQSWADAYERAGGQYYPKLLNAIPFTPVTGRRQFIHPYHPDQDGLKNALIAGAIQLTQDNDLSSVHFNFRTSNLKSGDKPLVFLHGFLGSHRNWDEIIKNLKTNVKQKKNIVKINQLGRKILNSINLEIRNLI